MIRYVGPWAPPRSEVQSLSLGIMFGMLTVSVKTLHYGPHSHQVAPPRDDAPYDLFLTKPFESTRRAERIPRTTSLFARPNTAVPDQKKKPAKTKAASSLDPDIEALQNGLAAHEAARER